MPTVFCWDEISVFVNGQPLSEGELPISETEPKILTSDEIKSAWARLENDNTPWNINTPGDDIAFWTQLPQWKMAQLRNMGWKKRRRWQPVLWIIRNDSGLYSRRAVKGYK
jgi:hypothetical protein